MTRPEFTVGSIITNSMRQFAKIISLKNGVYGISGWTTKELADKATKAMQFLNGNGLKNVEIDSAAPKASKKTSAAAPADGKPTKAKIMKLSDKKLKTLCEELGLKATGDKAKLQARLCAHFGL